MKLWQIAIAIVFAVLAFAAASFGTGWWGRDAAVPAIVSDRPWVEVTLGPRIAFDAPWPLSPDKLELTPDLTSVIRTSIFLTKEENGVFVSGIELAYREDITPNLDGAADGAIAKIRAQPGTLSVAATKTETTALGARAIEIDVRARRGAQPMRLRGLVFVNHNVLFIVTVAAREDHATAAAIWPRIRDSVRLR